MAGRRGTAAPWVRRGAGYGGAPGYGDTPGYGSPGYGTPPGYGGAPGYAYGAPGYGYGAPVGGSGLGDLGEWLGDTFKVLMARAAPVALLLLGLPALGAMGITTALWMSVADIQVDTVTDRWTGFNPAALMAAGLLAVTSTLLWLFGFLAASHQLYHAHAGQPASLGASMAAGLRRLPRGILWGVIVGLGMVALAGLFFGLPIVLAAAADDASWLFLWLLTVPAWVVAAIWFGVKLYYLWLAIVVAPIGTNPISVSFDLVRGRFWATLGRVFLLGLLASAATTVIQVIINLIVQTSLLAAIDTNPVSGEPQINGQDISNVDVFVVNDVLPALPLLLFLVVLYTANQAISQSLNLSGSAGLYRRAGGSAAEA